MGILSYDEFLNEEDKVKLDKDLREYTLTHMKDDRFQLKSGDFFKEFSVLPYKAEQIEPLKKAHSKLSTSVEDMSIQSLLGAVRAAESIPYSYGGVYNSPFSFNEIPELLPSLDADQQQALATSEREFILNNFSQLGKTVKDSIIDELRERAEVLCAVIEALFYYIRTIDKDEFYDGMNQSELVKEYETYIEKASKEAGFSFEGPFSEPEAQNNLSANSRTAFWACEKNMKAFLIQATVLPKELYAEENIGGTKGLKFSLTTEDDTDPEKDYSFFNVGELASRVKSFYDNILKKK
jgi:hypothetical protein